MAESNSTQGVSLRATLHSAFAYVRSTEANKATANISLDHLITEQISFLKKDELRSIVDGRGDAAGYRASRMDKILMLEASLKFVINEVASAGDDPEKLAKLGIYEVEMTPKKGDSPNEEPTQP